MIEINPVLTRVMLVVIIIKKISIILVDIPIVVPTIDPSFVNNVTVNNIDQCRNLVPVSDIPATPRPLPSPVCIRKGRNLKQLHYLRKKYKNDKLY